MKGARHLSKEEIKNLAQSFYGEYEVRNRALFLLGLNIGTRISELLALNVGDVWQYGKAVEILELRKAITKGKKTRQIPLNEQAKEAIIGKMLRHKDPKSTKQYAHYRTSTLRLIWSSKKKAEGERVENV
jgi:integrase